MKKFVLLLASALGILSCGGTGDSSGTNAGSSGSRIIADIEKSAAWIAKALNSSGYKADFSLESLKDVDRFFDEQTTNGAPVPKGLLSEELGPRIFALGAYVGETLRRTYGGQWKGDDADPEVEINVELHLPDGTICWPMQRVMKRFQNGAEDGLYAYGHLFGENSRTN